MNAPTSPAPAPPTRLEMQRVAYVAFNELDQATEHQIARHIRRRLEEAWPGVAFDVGTLDFGSRIVVRGSPVGPGDAPDH